MGNGQGKPVDLNGEGTSTGSAANFIFILVFICFLQIAIGPFRFLSPCILPVVSELHPTWHHLVVPLYRAYPKACLRSLVFFRGNTIV